MIDPLDPNSPTNQKKSGSDNPPPLLESATYSPSSHSAPNNLSFPAPGQGKMSLKDEKFWASMGHLLGLTGIITAGVGYIVGPLVLYLWKKNESPFVDEHTKETINFSIVTTIAVYVSGLTAVTSVPVLGWCLAPLVPFIFMVMNLIFCIQGASAARDGLAYRYPFNWRIIK